MRSDGTAAPHVRWPTRLRHAIERGVRLGFKFALAYCVAGTLGFTAHSLWGHDDLGNLTWPTLIFGYLAGGLVTGALGGAFSLIVRSRFASYLAGVVASWPTFALFYLTMYGRDDREEFMIVTIGISILLGGVCGIIVREIFARDASEGRNG